MAFTLKNVVPWGRSFDEYRGMFALSEEDIKKRILGCGDGPASFNRILTERGGSVISVDPIYIFSAEEIKKRIDDTYKDVIMQTEKNRHEFVWKHISSVEELAEIRMTAMNQFLADYSADLKKVRYIAAALPDLPFKNRVFDIALCSHFLFLYSEQFSEDFHFRSIRELCRVASEARIFPLLELGSKKSRHLEAVINMLKKENFEIVIEKVDYEFQKGGNQMLKVRNIKAAKNLEGF